MTTSFFETLTVRRAPMRARWTVAPDGALVCTWSAGPPTASPRRRTPITLTGRRHLPTNSAALRALTASLDAARKAA